MTQAASTINIHLHRLAVLVVCCLTAGWSYAQSWQLPLERRVTESIENHLSKKDSTFHTAMKPFHNNMVNLDSVDRLRVDDRRYFNTTEERILGTHMFEVREKDFTLLVDVILDLDLGFEYGDSANWVESQQNYNNTRGVSAYGSIGDRVSFHAAIFETQTVFPYWIRSYTDSLGVVPGQGRFKDTSVRARDYGIATGLVSIEAAKWLNVHFGHGKHFIGHGYRSMLLSDVAFNYPYIRLQAETRNRKLQYTWTTAELNSLDRLPLGEVPESLFQRKGFAFRYLSWMPHPRFEIGLYEAVIHQRWDSTGTQSYPATFYQPVPFLATAVHGLNDIHNSLVGVNGKVKLTDHIHVYGQFVADQAERRFTGFQAGIFANHLFPNFSARFEYNEGGQGIFTHQVPLQNYGHMNQSMAHPLGTNFKEYVVILQHQKKRFWSEWRGFMQHNHGNDRSNFAVTPEQVLAAPHQPGTTYMSDIKIGYNINPRQNMHAILGWTWRDRVTEGSHFIASFYYLTFRVAMFNRYYDI